MKRHNIFIILVLLLSFWGCKKDNVDASSIVKIKYTTKTLITGYSLFEYVGNTADMKRVRKETITNPSSTNDQTYTYAFDVINLQSGKEYVIEFTPNTLGSKLIKTGVNSTTEYTF